MTRRPALAVLAALATTACIGATTDSPAPLDVKTPGSWRRLAPMPTARQEVAAAALHGRVFVIGGIGALVYPRPLDDRPTVVVLSLWVTPSARDTRAAARLLRAVEGWAARQGANSVSVPSWQERSDVFYQSLGYVPQERVWNKKVKAG